MTAKTRVKDLSKEFGLGDSLRIDSSLTTGQPLIVDQIWEWSPPSLNPMVDYVLANNPGDGSPVRLRIMRQENADRSKAAILTLYDRFPYSEQFHDVVRSDLNRLVVQDSPSENGSHVSPVKIRSKAGRPIHANVEFWDYSRLTDVNGVEAEEFIFVEMNSADRAFEVWRGLEVPVEGYSALAAS